MLKLLIAVDGSEHANHAIKTIARLALETGPMEVILVHATGNLPLDVDRTLLIGRLQEIAVRTHQLNVLEDASHLAQLNGLMACTTEALSGRVAQAIVGAAERGDVDQIVIGTRGRKTASSHFLGSVASQVIQLSKRPVLLVR